MGTQLYLRVIVLFVVSGAVTYIPTVSHATPVGTGAAFLDFRLQNETGRTVEDYHLAVMRPLDPDGFPLPPPALVEGTIGGTVVRSADVSTDMFGNTLIDVNVTVGGAGARGKLKFVSQKNEIRVTASYWTVKDIHGNPARIPPEDKGDACCPAGGGAQSDTIYTIYNDLDFHMNINGLQFLQNVPEIPFELFDSVLLPGFGPTVPDFTLLPHTSQTFDLGGTVDPGNWLYAQALVSDSVYRFGHQAPIPEPSTWLLLGSGLVWIIWRKHQKVTVL